jgi:hypothetical protein
MVRGRSFGSLLLLPVHLNSRTEIKIFLIRKKQEGKERRERKPAKKVPFNLILIKDVSIV